MSSKRIAEKTGKQHAHVLRDIRSMLDKLSKIDNPNLDDTEYQIVADERGYTSEIKLNERLSLCLAAGYSVVLRMAIIDDWAQMKAATQTPKPGLASLSRLDILQMAIESETERLRLEAENKKLAPKAEVVDIILTAKNCYTTTDIAKELGMGAQTLNKKLCEMRIQRKFQNHYVLYAKYQDKGYTETKTEVIQPKNKDPFTVLQMVWTQKGRLFIHSKMNPKLSFYNPQQQVATA